MNVIKWKLVWEIFFPNVRFGSCLRRLIHFQVLLYRGVLKSEYTCIQMLKSFEEEKLSMKKKRQKQKKCEHFCFTTTTTEPSSSSPALETSYAVGVGFCCASRAVISPSALGYNSRILSQTFSGRFYASSFKFPGSINMSNEGQNGWVVIMSLLEGEKTKKKKVTWLSCCSQETANKESTGCPGAPPFAFLTSDWTKTIPWITRDSEMQPGDFSLFLHPGQPRAPVWWDY